LKINPYLVKHVPKIIFSPPCPLFILHKDKKTPPQAKPAAAN
jgi:hypothetical protein